MMYATENIKIFKLHVRDGSFVSPSTVCLSVSNEKNEIKKITAGSRGIIKMLCTVSESVSKSTQLFTLTECDHSVRFADLCGMCGQTIPKDNANLFARTIANDRYAICHGNKNTCVSEKMAMEYSLQENVSLLQKRKLVLLVDLDLTILQTATQNTLGNNCMDIFSFHLKNNTNRPLTNMYYTKLRPNCAEFLQEMHELFQMQIYTFGNRSYAKAIQKKIDPDKKFFSNRITSRDDSFDLRKKTENLKSLFPRGDNMVCIIDDRTEVWNDAPNLVHVKPYIIFPEVGDINNPFFDKSVKNKLPAKEDKVEETSKDNQEMTETDKELDNGEKTEDEQKTESKSEFVDNDDFLKHLSRILKTIHDKYFEEYDRLYETLKSEREIIHSGRLPHVKDVMSQIRKGIMTGCRVSMTGLVRHDKPTQENDCVQILKKMGGVYQDKLILPSSVNKVSSDKSTSSSISNKPYTTHLVANIQNTEKLKQAIYYVKSINKQITQKTIGDKVHRLEIVSQEWLWRSYFLWERTPDKDCLFYPNVRQLPAPEGCNEVQYNEDEHSDGRKMGKKRRHSSSDQREEITSKRRCLSPLSNKDIIAEVDECIETDRNVYDSTPDSDDDNEPEDSSSEGSSDANSEEIEKELDLLDQNFVLNYGLDMQNDLRKEVEEAIFEENEEARRNSVSPGVVSDHDDDGSRSNSDSDSSNSNSNSSSSSDEEQVCALQPGQQTRDLNDIDRMLNPLDYETYAQHKEGLAYLGLDISSDEENSDDMAIDNHMDY